MIKTYLTGGIELYSSYAKALGDNGLSADACCTLMIAPEVNGDCEWLYMTTNGDDVLIGWIDQDGNIERCDEVAGWIEEDDAEWLRNLLAEEWLRNLLAAGVAV